MQGEFINTNYYCLKIILYIFFNKQLLTYYIKQKITKEGWYEG